MLARPKVARQPRFFFTILPLSNPEELNFFRFVDETATDKTTPFQILVGIDLAEAKNLPENGLYLPRRNRFISLGVL